MSFVFLGIYWNNHHHMFHLVTNVTGGMLWANLHLLFWLSLVPFVDELDGAEPHRAAADGALWRRAAARRHRVDDSAEHDHRRPGPGIRRSRRRSGTM